MTSKRKQTLRQKFHLEQKKFFEHLHAKAQLALKDSLPESISYPERKDLLKELFQICEKISLHSSTEEDDEYWTQIQTDFARACIIDITLVHMIPGWS